MYMYIVPGPECGGCDLLPRTSRGFRFYFLLTVVLSTPPPPPPLSGYDKRSGLESTTTHDKGSGIQDFKRASSIYKKSYREKQVLGMF